ncbi:MAG: hypothetical protein K5905_15985 [Roseibium sp.]|nr:hypothetical protein [Roseibium sp.]MCV0426962.1 hypothetical protein [Roseibium sp.]
MKFWSFAFVALVLVGVAAAKATNPSQSLTETKTFSGHPVTTLHTPVTP